MPRKRRMQQCQLPDCVRPLTKAEAVELGAHGLTVGAGMRAESFLYLNNGGKPSPALPITINVWPDGSRQIGDGRHRITLGRARGAKALPGRIIGYGPRGGVIWRYTGMVRL